ncbi:uncharacterized protein LOC114726550 [Neltuma alba]|uniref:uncharacterized protein LOC114726550 n=1 Tax=Neltuma alba TaxID=207710 RepID=UPI0010A2B727|nr:uncharacterized protein LOC114726550 [Prosopis alba]
MQDASKDKINWYSHWSVSTPSAYDGCCKILIVRTEHEENTKKMKIFSLRSQLYILRTSTPTSSSSKHPFFLKPIKIASHGDFSQHKPTSKALIPVKKHPTLDVSPRDQISLKKLQVPENGHSNSRFLTVGAVSLGIFLVLIGIDGEKALALGPEGPLMEEFWDNVRRYALYALTVSTGAIYTIFQPIVELLKNPISAILVLAIFGGSIYLVSQVLSAMVGVTDFSYDYGY